MDKQYSPVALNATEFEKWLGTWSEKDHDPVYDFFKAVYGRDVIHYDPKDCAVDVNAGSGYINHIGLGFWAVWLHSAMAIAGWDMWDPSSRLEKSRIQALMTEVRAKLAAR